MNPRLLACVRGVVLVAICCLLPTACEFAGIRAHRHRRELPRGLSGRGGRRQRRQEARHHRRGRQHLCLVRESDVEEADRDRPHADARNHLERDRRPRRRRQGRDRHRLRVCDERANKGKLLLAAQGRSATIPGRSLPIADVGSIHRLRWGDVDGNHQLDLVVAPIFGPDAKPPTYSGAAELLVFSRSGSPGSNVWRSSGRGQA